MNLILIASAIILNAINLGFRKAYLDHWLPKAIKKEELDYTSYESLKKTTKGIRFEELFAQLFPSFVSSILFLFSLPIIGLLSPGYSLIEFMFYCLLLGIILYFIKR